MSHQVNYDGQRGSVNATILPAEMQRDRAANKKAIEAQVASHQEYKRVPKGKRVLNHEVTEDHYEDGSERKVKVEVKTTRTNR